jgi:nucleoside-diphosphate-sugar epimerase
MKCWINRLILVSSYRHLGKFPSVAFRKAAIEALEKTTNLESTRIHTGFFMDYWGMPAVKSYMTPISFVVDIPSHVAGIPGSGDVPVTFTHVNDVAKFAAAMLDLGKWDPVSYVFGDRVTWNEFVRLAEEATGKTTPDT